MRPIITTVPFARHTVAFVVQVRGRFRHLKRKRGRDRLRKENKKFPWSLFGWVRQSGLERAWNLQTDSHLHQQRGHNEVSKSRGTRKGRQEGSKEGRKEVSVE